MRIIIARHGETPWNREGRYQGHTDIPLSSEGEQQAAALGRRLASVAIDRAVASPLVRARKTAELALGDRANLLTLDPDLVEISHGKWEGRLASDIAGSDGELLARWQSSPGPDLPAGPDAETLGQVTTRAWRALTQATNGLGPDQTLLLVAHDAVNRALLCKTAGIPLERVWSFQQSPATVNALVGTSMETLQIVRLNDASHYADLFGAAAHRAL